MNAPAGHIQVVHGSLTVNVPRDIFRGPKAELIEDKVAVFRSTLRTRYPWLSENAVDVIMRNARKEMLRVIDEESKGRIPSKQMDKEGKTEAAIEHLKRHLERDPNDADSWYTLGELLCKIGKVEEGYKAMNRGRSLI